MSITNLNEMETNRYWNMTGMSRESNLFQHCSLEIFHHFETSPCSFSTLWLPRALTFYQNDITYLKNGQKYFHPKKPLNLNRTIMSGSEFFDVQTYQAAHSYYLRSLCRKQGKLYESCVRHRLPGHPTGNRKTLRTIVFLFLTIINWRSFPARNKITKRCQ